jgi:endogenous inhibitor of DNA gyrase (YacG/DUF329 family)
MSAPYAPPTFQAIAFNCPLCGAFAKQNWGMAHSFILVDYSRWLDAATLENTFFAHCSNCEKPSIWLDENMIYPTGGAAPLPNLDMPADVRQDYEEARSILAISPRGSAALLRLAVQRLCKHLGQPGENINADIAALVRQGLPVTLQKALDSLRVAGNNAVHPGQLDIYDTPEVATRLFGLLNIIVDNQITQPKAISELYDTTVPADTQQHIAKRDAPRA